MDLEPRVRLVAGFAAARQSPSSKVICALRGVLVVVRVRKGRERELLSTLDVPRNVDVHAAALGVVAGEAIGHARVPDVRALDE